MQETLYQTFNAGVCITNNGCRSFYIRQGSVCLHMIQWYMFLHCKSCTQESLLQTAAAGVAMSDTSYGASLTEDCNRQRVHESFYQTHVQILKVLSEGVKTPLKMYHHPSSEAQLNVLLLGR